MKSSTEARMVSLVSYISFILFGLICLLPMLMVVAISFTSEQSIAENGFQLIPKEFSLEAYKLLFANPGQILDAYKTTAIVTITGTVLSVLFTSQAAYVTSRSTFRAQKQISFMFYFTQLFNGGLVPTYVLVTQYLHLKNSLWAIILIMMISPWNVFLLRTYIKGVPESLIESAKLDGASEFRIFYQIVFPLTISGIATVAITTAIGYWNDWYQNMLYITDVNKYSLQYLLQTLLGKIDFLKAAGDVGMLTGMALPEESLRMATCVVAIGPMAILFLFVQKFFVKGITVGSVKG
ncbi:MAG: carbohydrate ABC transporter permease [Eubacteriales bacterium]|nr:carbohydrate ABC transporter permease [Eubacteriales bacterium]